MTGNPKAIRYSIEVRARTVRMVHEHRGDYGNESEAVRSIASKIGCMPETLRKWMREESAGKAVIAKAPPEESERIKALEREVRELRQANEILRKASAYFAQAELDRPFKR